MDVLKLQRLRSAEPHEISTVLFFTPANRVGAHVQGCVERFRLDPVTVIVKELTSLDRMYLGQRLRAWSDHQRGSVECDPLT